MHTLLWGTWAHGAQPKMAEGSWPGAESRAVSPALGCGAGAEEGPGMGSPGSLHCCSIAGDTRTGSRSAAALRWALLCTAQPGMALHGCGQGWQQVGAVLWWGALPAHVLCTSHSVADPQQPWKVRARRMLCWGRGCAPCPASALANASVGSTISPAWKEALSSSLIWLNN